MSEFPLRARASGIELLFSPDDPQPSVSFDLLLERNCEDAFARGQAQARQEADTRIAALETSHADRLASLEAAHAEALATLRQQQDSAFAAVEAAFADALLPLVLDIVRTILSVAPAEETIASLVAEVLAAFPEDQTGILYGPPGICPALPAGWAWHEDPDLTPGSVRAEVAATRVTASISARLAQLAQDLQA